MHASRPNDSGDDPIEAAAAKWLVLQDRGLTPAQQDSFLAWITADPAHRQAFERHRGLWREFDALSQWRPEHGAEPNPDLLARPRRRIHWPWLAVSSLAAAAVLSVFLWPGLTTPRPTESTVEFEASSSRQEVMTDGSTLDLNRGAHVVVHYSAKERRVLLVQGEAQFTVAKNPARPFIVRAGGVDVRAVGTAFDVKFAPSGVEVLVTEGTVHLSRSAVASPGSPPAPVFAAVTAGQQTLVPSAPSSVAPAVVPVAAAEIERRLEWRPRLLDFDSTPLEQVIALFNHQNDVHLSLADPALGDLPIVGSIRSDNVQGFVRLVEATMGLKAERHGNEIVLSRTK